MTSSALTQEVVYRKALPEDIGACIELRGIFPPVGVWPAAVSLPVF